MRNKRLITGLGLIAVCSILFTVSSSLMWFDNKTTITPDEVTGSSDGAYYASGSGTKDDPYIINQPRHLYNLAWLQYLGAYNKDTDGDGKINEIYFEVEGNTTNSGGDSVLDMSGWVLPPIGTEDNPFVGNFNGNNTIIKNLTVSNTFSDYGDKHPYYNANNEVMSETTFTQPKIIGFFGVIGALDSQTYEYTSNIEVEGAAYTDANLVYDTYVDNITIENNTENQELLAGLLVGYVNAPIIQSGVGYGEFDFASGTTNLSSSNTPSGATINGVSNYSLIGAYNPNSFKYTGLPTTDSGSSSGTGTDWGASINMETINRRMNYMISSYTKYEKSGTATRFTQSSRFNLYARYGQTGEWYYNDQTATINGYANLADGTIIPLTIDTDKAFTVNGEANKDKEITLGSNKFHITDYYDSDTNTEADIVSNSNSGYFIGGGTMSDNGTIDSSGGGYLYTRRQLVSSAMSGAGQSSTYSSSSAKFRYIDTNGTDGELALTKGADGKITANSMNYEKANTVITQFNTDMEGKRWAHGLRFYGTNNFSSNYTDSLEAKLIGKTYSKYQFVKSGLNFTVKEKGYITVIMSTAMSAKVMFDLYKVNRGGCTSSSSCTDEHTISSVEQINQIYKYQSGTSSAGAAIYSYDYNENSHNGSIAFDFTKISPSSENALYYFEIPVEPGDYVIGKNTAGTSNNTSFILYLDIGTSGNTDSSSGTEPTTTSPTEIDFVYYDSSTKKLVKITSEKDSDGNYIYKNSNVVFQIGSSASGTVSFNRTTSDAVLYYIGSNTIQVIGTGTSTNKEKQDEVPKNS